MSGDQFAQGMVDAEVAINKAVAAFTGLTDAFGPATKNLMIGAGVVGLWGIFAIVIGAAAGARGRNGFGWLLLSIFVSPLLAAILLAILPDLKTNALLKEITRRTAEIIRRVDLLARSGDRTR
jgi:hypothetical protein